MKFLMRHTIDIGANEFWDRLFFDPVYNQAVYCGHLEFEEYSAAFDRRDDGTVQRTVVARTRMALPAILRKLMGNVAGYTEIGVYDPRSGHFVANIIPSVAGDKITSSMDLWLESRSDHQVERFLEVECNVRVLGLGGLMEAALASQLRDSSNKIAAFTNDWLARERSGVMSRGAAAGSNA